VNVSAKADYALRALVEMAGRTEPVFGETLAELQGISTKFLFAILNDLRRAGIVASQRGPDGGYRLARPADQLTAADVIRAVDGPIAVVRNLAPEDTTYQGAAAHLSKLWVAVRASLRLVLEDVTIADLLHGEFSEDIHRLVADPDAWSPEVGLQRHQTPQRLASSRSRITP
jgi:Rrf2 family protein